MSHEHDLPMQPDKKPVVPRSENEKEKIKNRLKKIEGQIRGLEKMVDEDRYCVDILIQIAAVQAALKKLALVCLSVIPKCVCSTPWNQAMKMK